MPDDTSSVAPIIDEKNFHVDAVTAGTTVQVSLRSSDCVARFSFDNMWIPDTGSLVNVINAEIPWRGRTACLSGITNAKHDEKNNSPKTKIEFPSDSSSMMILCGDKVGDGAIDYEAIVEKMKTTDVPKACRKKYWNAETPHTECSILASKICSRALDIRVPLSKALQSRT